ALLTLPHRRSVFDPPAQQTPYRRGVLQKSILRPPRNHPEREHGSPNRHYGNWRKSYVHFGMQIRMVLQVIGLFRGGSGVSRKFDLGVKPWGLTSRNGVGRDGFQ